MSLYIDLKYLMMVAPRLGKFKKKADYLFNCRCPLCGDSTSNENKARGYFYKQRTGLFFKCHNCGVGKHFGTFLKDFDPLSYKNYVFERYSDGNAERKPHSKTAELQAPPVQRAPFSVTRKFERMAARLDTLPDEHPAVQYCLSRNIPEENLSELAVVKMADVLALAPQYKGRLNPKGPDRLAIPFYNEAGDLTGLTLRTIEDEALRYIAVKMDEDSEKPLIFGLQHVDLTKRIYVVEGALDSLFLPNAIACNGTSFGKIETLNLPKKRVVVVIDNQPRNREVCKVYTKYIALGYRVVIWPHMLEEKDLNEMATAGHDVREIVRANIHSGLAAQAAFAHWRKC